MKKFYVVIEETVADEFEVYTETKEDAIKKYKSGEFVLCPRNLEYKQIAVVENDEEISEWIKF